MKYCCEEFEKAVRKNFIILYSESAAIRGEPEMVNDGDGYFDDMTSEEGIGFCPFCGAELAKVLKETQ